MADIDINDEQLIEQLDLTWRDLAACREHDPDLFFPAGDTGPAVAQISAARRMCGECPVAEECLTYAIETNQMYGIWGGTTEQERRLIRRRWLTARRRNDPAAMERVVRSARPA